MTLLLAIVSTYLQIINAWGAEPAAKDLNSFLDHAKSRKSLTIDGFLDALPDVFWDQVSLVTHSPQAVQEASLLKPRVILSGGLESNLTLAITGEGLRGSNIVEAIEQDPKTKQFAFYKITFDRNGALPPKIQKNPPSCNSCHHGHPIWDGYPIWSGTYGSAEGGIEGTSVKSSYQKFVEFRKSDGRYRRILNLGELSNRFEKNIEIGLRLSRQNFDRVLQTLIDHPNFEGYSRALALAGQIGADSASLQHSLQVTDADAFTERYLRALSRTKHEVESYISDRLDRHQEASGVSKSKILSNRPNAVNVANYDRRYIERFARLRLVAEDMGLPADFSWTMTKKADHLSFIDGQTNFGYLADRLLRESAKRDPVLMTLLKSDRVLRRGGESILDRKQIQDLLSANPSSGVCSPKGIKEMLLKSL